MINTLNKLWDKLVGYLDSKKIYRDYDGAILAGVCQGLANRFGINVSLLRVAWLLLTLVSFGATFIVYIILIMTIPSKPRKQPNPFAKSSYIDGRAWEKK